MTVMDPTELQALCQSIPKVELHCHLLGTLREATLRDLNVRAGRPLADHEIDQFYTRGKKPVGVLRILRALEQHLLRHARDLYRITCEYLQDAHAHNVFYTEFFWNPTGSVRAGWFTYEQGQTAIVEAIRDCENELKVTGRLIPAIDREADPSEALRLVEWMIAHRDPRVIGLGVDYNEVNHPPQLFQEAYTKARAAGFHTTAHAGEFGMPWTNVAAALNLLKVDRVDHGYTVLQNEELVRQCVERGVVFTVVPTNSYYLRTLAPEEWAQKHPIRGMVKHGLRVHPNTDDPTYHQTTPTKSWMMMVTEFDCSVADLRTFCLNGIDGAWVSEEVKKEWRKACLEAFEPYP